MGIAFVSFSDSPPVFPVSELAFSLLNSPLAPDDVFSAFFLIFLFFLDGMPAARFMDLYAVMNIERFFVVTGARSFTLSSAHRFFPERVTRDAAPVPVAPVSFKLGRLRGAGLALDRMPPSGITSGSTRNDTLFAILSFLPPTFAIAPT
jgi:hypothetical protein